ncbi:MAG: GNAT family N-acetyltransferase [Lachnospiraceae bacterium]|nr:GNAT family N-acetyltransferase [Lachnospiraceae bacterium]
MDLIVIIGSGAVGKMTVGQELVKITDFRLFHNHMMIEPVMEIFGKCDGAIINRLRNDIFEEFMKTKFQGMIFTFMWAFDRKEDWDYLKSVTDKFEKTGGTVYYVELVADQTVRLKRNGTENRLLNKASKRDVEISNDRLRREDSKFRLVSNKGEVPFDNYIKIDNTNLDADKVALMIKEHFNLPGKSIGDLYNSIYLEEVNNKDIEELYNMQIESFMPLYEKYHDDLSPAIEPLENVIKRANNPDRKYYFITKDSARVGVINIGTKNNNKDVYYISPIFVAPKYQNRGYGYIGILKAFEKYNDAKEWRLETILQEKGNCHLYEKCGFVRTDEEIVVNDKMTLIGYVKKV